MPTLSPTQASGMATYVSARSGDGSFAARPLLRAGICTTVAASLMAIGIARFDPVWAANDDPTMIAFANGDYAGGVASRLVHMNVAIGQLLAFLYSWLPRVPWYSLMLWGGWIAAWSAALFVAASGSARGRGMRLVLALLAIGIGFPGAALIVTFTSGAFGIGVAGLLLMTLAATRTQRAARLAAGLGGAALVASAMVRWDSFLGIVLAFLPVWVAIAFRAGMRRSLVTAGVVAIAAFGVHQADRIAYTHNDEWRAYDETRVAYKELKRGNRLLPSDALDAAAQSLGWTAIETELLAGFLFADPDVYTIDALETLLDRVPAQRAADLSEVYGIAFEPYHYFLWTLLGICLAHLIRIRRLMPSIWIVGSLAWFAAVMGYLTMYVRFPSRTAVPFWTTAVLVAAVVPDVLLTAQVRSRPMSSVAPAARRALTGAIVVAFLMVVSNAGDRIDSISVRADALRGRYARDAETLRGVDPNGIFIGMGGSVTTTGTDPRRADTAFGELRYVELGWATFSPHMERRLAQMGITNLYESLVHDEGVYFVASARRAKYLEHFLLKHHGWEVRFREVSPLHGNVSVWTATTPSRPQSSRNDDP